MKRKTKAAALLITGTIIAASLVGCAARTSPEESPNTPSELPTEKDVISTYTAQIEHYESMIRDLEADLLNEKEENYITVAEYKMKIEELEASIEALSNKSESDNASDEPTSEGKENLDHTNDILKPPANLDFSAITTQESGGKLTVTGYRGNKSELILPSQINGCSVTAIGEAAFVGSHISKLTLPDSVTEIDWFAFSECLELTEIVIPSSVTLIGYGAFDGCSSDLTIICEKGSYAERYAQSWGITYKCE